MKITAVEVFGVECGLPAPLRWGTMEVATKGGVLVRVRTDEGLEGLGEAGFSIAYLSRVAPVTRTCLRRFVCPNFRREVRHFSVPADVVQMENEQIHS